MRILIWVLPILLLTSLPAQSLRSVTNEKKGFKMRMPRFLKEVPLQPNEEQILAKYKGTKSVRVPRGMKYVGRDGKPMKEYPLGFELWVVRIVNPGGVAPKTPGRGDAPKREADLADRIRAQRNGGRTIEEFLKRRMRIRDLAEVSQDRPLKDKNREPYTLTQGPPGRDEVASIQAYTVEHRHDQHGHELFGVVFLCASMGEFEKLLPSCVRSLQRLDKEKSAYAKEDPYAGSSLPDIPKRRSIRSRMVDGWYAEDTENFILVTDMTNNTENRRLLRDMMIDLETMRKEFEKRFPPIRPLDVVCTVRVCNSYAGYQRYSNKPGTGGYWHPINEELVLFNPVGKIKKEAWMRRVSPKAILYHEAMHQYFHYANGEMPPASWFNEGYGEYFGGAKTDRYEKVIRSIEKNDFRWQVVKKAKKDKVWPEIKRILPMSQQTFYSRKSKDYPVLNNYAFAWAFCYFLEKERAKPKGERNETWAAIPDRYLENLRAATEGFASKLPENAPKGGLLRFVMPVQKQAYDRTFKDIDFKALQADWVAAMKSW